MCQMKGEFLAADFWGGDIGIMFDWIYSKNFNNVKLLLKVMNAFLQVLHLFSSISA